MAETIVTYDLIYEILRKEKYEPEVQNLPENFYSKVIEYLKEKQLIVETQKSQQSIFSGETAKTEKQVQNIKKLLKEIYERRENKIIQLAIFASRSGTKLDLSNMLQEEQEFFKATSDSLSLYRKGILYNLLELKHPKISKPKDIKTDGEETTKLIRFTSSVPKFMGEDLNVYGPFYSDDIASLPAKATSLLIKTKRAQEIKK